LVVKGFPKEKRKKRAHRGCSREGVAIRDKKGEDEGGGCRLSREEDDATAQVGERSPQGRV